MQNFIKQNSSSFANLILEKFLRYVAVDTQSKEDSNTYPSTEKQLDLAKILFAELKVLGIKNVTLNNYGYVIASIPSNLPQEKASKASAIAFIAHLDTSPAVSGMNVRPQIIKNYQGGNITLSGDKSIVISPEESKGLKLCLGHDIVTSDGTTLLGADDKAGIAIIMAMAELFTKNPTIPHSEIKIVFTPDEEVGAGTKFFDTKNFGTKFAYTIDGEHAPIINKETFSADTAIVTVYGKDIHPGSAKNIMVNSVRVISDIIKKLPKEIAPETTENYEPYLHPYILEGNVAKSTIKILLRDFKTEGLAHLKKIIEKIITEVQATYPKTKIELEVVEGYRNMHDDLEKDPRITDYLEKAVAKTGLKPEWKPIRGGTDGSKLTAEGILTPNIFTGGDNFHSKTEWVSVQGMQKSLETVLYLIEIWTETPK
jgi:tripeptide aminopeptidase